MRTGKARAAALLTAAALVLAGTGVYLAGQGTAEPVSARRPRRDRGTTGGSPFRRRDSRRWAMCPRRSCPGTTPRYLGDTEEKVIYLTFDCGYENGYTGQILDVLKAHNAPAAFFVVGHMVESAPDLVKRMAREGHIVGNHTYSHRTCPPSPIRTPSGPSWTSWPSSTARPRGRNSPATIVRPRGNTARRTSGSPGFGLPDGVLESGLCGLVCGPTTATAAAFDKLIPRIHSGAIVLLHSTSRTNGEILDQLLTRWEKLGYRFASLDELPWT